MIDIFRVVVFLMWVNGLPPLISVLLDDRFPQRIDGGRLWSDGRPIFGAHKTIRGVLTGVFIGALAFPVLGVPFQAALIAAFLAMTGDLLTSFCKRRFTLKSGSEAAVFDQFLEAFLPLSYLYFQLDLNLPKSIIILTLFTSLGFCCSRLWQHIAQLPPLTRYPRTFKAGVRFKEWKACHVPLSRYHTWFNLTSFLSDQVLLTIFFKISGLYSRGMRNALDIRVEEKTFYFHELPHDFDGFTLLFLTDLHLDGMENLTEKIYEQLAGVEADLCLVGGDIRMKTFGEISSCLERANKLMQAVKAEHGIFGVLGNHDCVEMIPDLEDAGIVMLINDAVPIIRNRSKIWLIGVDDPHYYRLDDTGKAAAEVPPDVFTIYLAHSPEAYREAAQIQANLYLCGHTHGGQVCLANGTPIITNSRAPRFTASGVWRYQEMQGYTSRGGGPSSIPVRFNCPGEITRITLRKK